MHTYLTQDEIDQTRQLLQDYAPAAIALTTLEAHLGDLEASFDQLWTTQIDTPVLFDIAGQNSLCQVTLKVLCQEICRDQSFCAQVMAYTQNSDSAPALQGLIVYLVGWTTLPLNPAIATLVVLYLLKLGLITFCERR